MLGGPLDPLLYTLQVLTPIAFIGLLALAGWNVRQAFLEKRRWFVKVWAVALLLSAAVLLWVVAAFNLIGFGTNY